METWKEIDLNIKQYPIGRLLSCFWVLKVLMAVPELQPAPRIDVIMLGSGVYEAYGCRQPHHEGLMISKRGLFIK